MIHNVIFLCVFYYYYLSNSLEVRQYFFRPLILPDKIVYLLQIFEGSFVLYLFFVDYFGRFLSSFQFLALDFILLVYRGLYCALML